MSTGVSRQGILTKYMYLQGCHIESMVYELKKHILQGCHVIAGVVLCMAMYMVASDTV